MMKLILGLFFVSSISFAAKLEDVKVLDMKSGQDSFELKLQTADGPSESYFFVTIVKNDPESFDKLAHIVKKLAQGDQYKLDLNIPSFSASPYGSSYRSIGIKFTGTSDREPNSVKKAQPKSKTKK
jgi:hypothetical protein